MQVKATNRIATVPFDALSNKAVSELGRRALAIRSGSWTHAESEHFIYHSLDPSLTTAVSVEAEFYYRIISTELKRDSAVWESKSHIFIFGEMQDWGSLVREGDLEPWTGGLNLGNELFIRRKHGADWENSTLGHEVAHLMVYRFMGKGVPLWLNEGYAEYASLRGFSAYYRSRGYRAKPVSRSLKPGSAIPLAQFTAMTEYPADEAQARLFYMQAERLTRFLAKTNPEAFVRMMDMMGKGNRFDISLASAYGGRFASVAALEREFLPYASKDYGTTVQEKDDE